MITEIELLIIHVRPLYCYRIETLNLVLALFPQNLELFSLRIEALESATVKQILNIFVSSIQKLF